MADSDSSPLSSAPSSDDEEMVLKMAKPTGLNRYFKPAPKDEPAPEPPKRAPSPPHDYTLADNEAIAFLVMFRSRFSDAFPKSLPHYGPQDIERGVQGEFPDEHAERLLCALLGLVLNRKKDVERGHHGRALEDAISTNQHQWLAVWNGVNPIHGGKSFNNMTPEERLNLLKALALWSLNQSEAVQAILKDSYKQTRRDDDRNQPRSVQPWFSDQYRRKYWLVEGLEDSHFRIYRENDGKTAKTNTWFSIAGSIPEVAALADKFGDEHTQNSKVISDKLRSAIPRFEAGDEKRKRRDYRLARKAAFARPEPGYSLYEGRTRGKRMKYTFSDEEYDSDEMSTKRSTRNSGFSTPLETGPTITASGRYVKSRVGGMYGESMLVDQRKELDKTTGEDHFTETSEDMPTTAPSGRGPRLSRSGRPMRPARNPFNDGAGSDSDEDQTSGREWSGNEDEPDESEPEFDREDEDDEDDQMSERRLDTDDIDDDDNTQESLVVQLRYRKGQDEPRTSSAERGPPLQESNGNSINSSAYRAIAAKSSPVVADTIDVTRRINVNGINGMTEGPLNSGNSLSTMNGNVSGNGNASEDENCDKPRDGIPNPRPQRMASVQVPLQPMDVS
ncbi:uncharacterized protein A1O9_03003 [Exophiala aquamarina CBS 119918]|uniref:WHIM1 domain-containing protein n=1 Tax=Exophiala aquamarina CBS 119918 TaxID=1182545 RepID=A0A072PNX4_9EURO|nr:uncharacterized protein A1O9_03003 [Exophiala aquamarina CBS 119918]KEF61437.1 hypothetical protein A1O9_03003 [Exophiala aquamarina CBS 119918]